MTTRAFLRNENIVTNLCCSVGQESVFAQQNNPMFMFSGEKNRAHWDDHSVANIFFFTFEREFPFLNFRMLIVEFTSMSYCHGFVGLLGDALSNNSSSPSEGSK